MTINRITQITIQNYRSIADLTVDLPPLTVLVGANASGKSNFVDALRFINDAVHFSVETAIVNRDSFTFIRYKSSADSPLTTIKLHLALNGAKGEYSLSLKPDEQLYATFAKIEAEEYRLHNQLVFERHGREVNYLQNPLGLPLDDWALGLVLLGGAENIAPANIFLKNMSFYTLFPDVMKLPETPTLTYPLLEDGRNLASALLRFRNSTWVDDYKNSLTRIIPDIVDLDVKQFGGFLQVQLKHSDGNEFNLEQESDGTIRILALLLALYQDPPRSLIAIEEPELLVHPGALSVLCDVIKEASLRSQIIITTHSPDLIAGFDVDSLRVVERTAEGTKISPIDDVQREVIEEQLFKASDLLRIDGGLRRASPKP